MFTLRSNQEVLGFVCRALQKRFNPGHMPLPAFLAGGSGMTERAFVTQRINNALGFAVFLLRYHCAERCQARAHSANAAVIYENTTCWERPGRNRHAAAEGGGRRDGGDGAASLPLCWGLRNINCPRSLSEPPACPASPRPVGWQVCTFLFAVSSAEQNTVFSQCLREK